MNVDTPASDYLRELASRIDPSTRLNNHVQLAIDLDGMDPPDASDTGTLVVVEVLDHSLVRRIFIASGSRFTDRLLREIARRIQSLLRPQSRLYYVGVGRFCVLTPRHGAELASFLSDIQAAMALPFESGNYTMRMDIVIGALPIADAKADPTDALQKVTVAACKAREEQSRVAHYQPAFDAIQLRKHRILQDIPAAIAAEQFSLVFQPKVDRTGALTGAEALLRWQHPELGPVGPAEFIPLADDTDLMVDITRWVVGEALHCSRQLALCGFPIRIALNASSRNLNDAEFSTFLLASLARFDVPPDRVQIECTEYSALKSDRCAAALHALSRAGLTIALDDFGSGHSNLASLQCLPIDLLKIDRSLIAPAAGSAHALRLLDGVIRLAKSLGYRTVAEGVETLQVLRMLQAMDIDEMQGYAIARPMDLNRLLIFAESRRAVPASG